ncbi:MAG TPA: ECF transporter S component [Sedimentibacter sp.]|jgi:riboflavin transporter FmnP|nr:ECF transporter S component [Sedimentibacter sp.]HAS91098.1 ECF transporter S component [Clostridiales bacterium]HOA19334.1 ECF transporter S component [Sedimentibacter sp.]HOT21612.1 ECF transporter S component [Sedimentibacter sp.]HPB78811.1 ECF transporter S component [Sedimentibacter sp.]
MKSDVTMNQRINTKTITKVGILGAVATVLMLLEFPLWFAPSFYELDFSEVPVLLGAFALGPAAGAMIELVKILINFVLNGTDTGGVGEFANFIIGCAFIVPAGFIYKRNKSFKTAILGLVVGTLTLALAGAFLNYYLLLPLYAKIYGYPIQAFIDMGNALNPAITDLKTFVLYAVVPFNLLKGTIVSAMVILIYKKLSPILHR